MFIKIVSTLAMLAGDNKNGIIGNALPINRYNSIPFTVMTYRIVTRHRVGDRFEPWLSSAS